jgi:hypothetical protein
MIDEGRPEGFQASVSALSGAQQLGYRIEIPRKWQDQFRSVNQNTGRRG